MKTIIKSSLLIGIFISSFVFIKQASAKLQYVSSQIFYDQLSSYGKWVDNPNYGYIWFPDTEAEFIPYLTEGQWALTDCGWTWVSNYNWGWAPFHYGRWDFDVSYGWFWVPDNKWGPSWVSWRRAEGYYGWMPMEPGSSIRSSFNSTYNTNNDHWVFVRDKNIESPDIFSCCVIPSDQKIIIRNSLIITNTNFDNTYVSGPYREEVQKVTGRKINFVTVQEINIPGQELKDGYLKIFKPVINNPTNSRTKSGPLIVTNLKNIKTHVEKKAAYHPWTIKSAASNGRKQQMNPIKQQSNNSSPQNKNRKSFFEN